MKVALIQFDPTVGDVAGNATRVVIAGTQAYVSAETFGLQVVEIADPTAPYLLGALDTPGTALDVATAGAYAFVADGYSGLQVLNAQCGPASGVAADRPAAGAPRLAISPNPASGRARIRMAHAQGGPVRATIHDLAGRRVRSLGVGSSVDDGLEFHWDGRTEDGRMAPAGVYLVRIATTSGIATARIMMLR